MTQLVQALRYKPEGRGLDYRWANRDFPLTEFFLPTRAVGSTPPVTEMITRDLFCGVKAAGAYG